MAEGYVYILTNRYVPDLVKIGYTDRVPDTRASELSNTTGVPGKWTVYTSWLLEDAYSYEQRIFSEFKKIRETGEFFRLSPDNAVENITVLLVSWGAIDSFGLSAASRREVERIQSIRARENAIKEEERRKQQVIEERKKIVRFLQQVSLQIKEQETLTSNAIHEKWKPWFRKNCIKNALIWGIGVFFVSLSFVKKEEGALLLAGIAALFAYGLGNNYHSDDFQIPYKKAKQDARYSVLEAQQLGYLSDKSKLTSGYCDHRGFLVDLLENWDDIEFSIYSFEFKNKFTGEIIARNDVIYIENIGYFDKGNSRLLV